MSNFQIEVFGSHIVDTDVESVKKEARALKMILDSYTAQNGTGDIKVKVFDYSTHKNVSLVEYEAPVVFTGRQDSEGMIQVMVKHLVKGGFVTENAVESIPDLTDKSMNLSTDNHYSVNYADLYESLAEFVVNDETFATDFKNTLSEILLNNTAGGSNFMKIAKNQAKKS